VIQNLSRPSIKLWSPSCYFFNCFAKLYIGSWLHWTLFITFLWQAVMPGGAGAQTQDPLIPGIVFWCFFNHFNALFTHFWG